MIPEISIPTIQSTITDKEISILYKVYHDSLNLGKLNTKLAFCFKNCIFFGNHACVFLGGLDLYLKHKFNLKEIYYRNLKYSVKEYFQRLGYFKKEDGWTNFPYSEFSMENIKNKKSYRDINQLLNSPLFPFKSNESKRKIKEIIGELFLNVYQHSRSPRGATSSAQYYSKDSIIRFSIVDFGIGIAKKIQNYYRINHSKNISSELAFLKAFDEGFTTKKQPYGLGLKTIKDFLLQNESKISIFCNDIFYQYDGKKDYQSGYKFNSHPMFSGTFIILEFNTKKICL